MKEPLLIICAACRRWVDSAVVLDPDSSHGCARVEVRCHGEFEVFAYPDEPPEWRAGPGFAPKVGSITAYLVFEKTTEPPVPDGSL